MTSVKFFEHPDYTARKDAWETYRDLFDGDHNTLTSVKYLWPHELEGSVQEAGRAPDGTTWTVGQKLRKMRSLRSRYLNLFEPIISNWISLAFSKAITISPEIENMLGEQELADIDGKGNSLENFIKTVLAPAYFRDGRPIVLVDAPGTEGGQFPNLAAQQAAGYRPYVELLDVLSVPDWQISDGGTFDALRYEYKAIAPRSSLTEQPEQKDYCKVLTVLDGQYTQIVYHRQGSEWIEENRITIPGWSELPVSAILHNEPWVKDCAELQLALFNLMSAWFNGLNTQAFQRVLISASGATEQTKISISEYTWSIIPEGSNVTTIEPANDGSLVNAMAWTINQMYRVAFNRTRGLSDASQESPGADTLREMNAELISLLKVALTELESIVNRFLYHYSKMKGVSGFAGRIEFDKNLSAEDVEKATSRFLAYRDEIRKVLPWRKAHLKKVASSEDFSESEMSEIFDAIENLKDDASFNPFAGIGHFTNGGQETAAQQAGEESNANDRGQGGQPRAVDPVVSTT